MNSQKKFWLELIEENLDTGVLNFLSKDELGITLFQKINVPPSSDSTPLSINGCSDGDLGHAYKGNKKVFVVNNRGEIFYTNPEVSKSCFDIFGGCPSEMGQVYLGNVEDYLQ